MDDRSLGECPVCNENFNENSRCPRNLPCSHYLCTDCIDILIKKKKKQCPFCRQSFDATSVQDIMVNRAILDFLKKLPCNREQRENSATLSFLKKETTDKIDVLFLSCVIEKSEAENALERIESANENLQFGSNKIDEVMSKLNTIRKENVGQQNTLKNAYEEIEVSLKDIEKREVKLRDIQRKLDKANTFEDTGAVMDETKALSTIIKTGEEQIKGFSSKDQIIQDIDQEAIGRKENICRILDAVDCMKVKSSPEMKHVSSPIAGGPLKVKELQEMTQKVKDSALQWSLFAIQNHEGVKRSAKITIRGDKLLLHHLTEKSPSSSALTIEHSEALPMTDPSSRLAFLELSADGLKLGTMYIRLTPDTQGARQFALLCTGQIGPSYANTRLLNVIGKGVAGEAITFGDYEEQNGKGGRALVTGLHTGEEYSRPMKSGTITGVGWRTKNNSVSAQFIIRTNPLPGSMSDSAFGEVEEGLSILNDVIHKYQNIRKVSIGDCGLVLCSLPSK